MILILAYRKDQPEGLRSFQQWIYRRFRGSWTKQDSVRELCLVCFKFVNLATIGGLSFKKTFAWY